MVTANKQNGKTIPSCFFRLNMIKEKTACDARAFLPYMYKEKVIYGEDVILGSCCFDGWFIVKKNGGGTCRKYIPELGGFKKIIL